MEIKGGRVGFTSEAATWFLFAGKPSPKATVSSSSVLFVIFVSEKMLEILNFSFPKRGCWWLYIFWACEKQKFKKYIFQKLTREEGANNFSEMCCLGLNKPPLKSQTNPFSGFECKRIRKWRNLLLYSRQNILNKPPIIFLNNASTDVFFYKYFCVSYFLKVLVKFLVLLNLKILCTYCLRII